ncbi:MAG: hypothetical protein HFE74_00640 [Firmicutes bacterium]|jgi:TusA-related sulfurtransferase|nr:hypothetical protein [Bacillota bacterium]
MLVDARGCSCPQPVIMTKKALEKESKLEVLVDNNTAMNNVTRLAKSQGCTVTVKDGEIFGDFIIEISK